MVHFLGEIERFVGHSQKEYPDNYCTMGDSATKLSIRKVKEAVKHRCWEDVTVEENCLN